MLFAIYILFAAFLFGILAGLSSSAFLYSLDWVTSTRQQYPIMIWTLPIFGFLFALLCKKISRQIQSGMPDILQSLEQQNNPPSVWLAPFIFFSSLGSHLFGASVGREGVGILMSTGLNQLVPKFRFSAEECRVYFIYCGIAAGFSAIFATPLAAIIFAFELFKFKDTKKLLLLFACCISSLTAYSISHTLGPIHQNFEVNSSFSIATLNYVFLAGICAGLAGLIFYWALKFYSKQMAKYFPHMEWRMAFGGLAISAIVYFTKAYQYIGIGTDMIQKSFEQGMSIYDFIFKCIFSIMSIGVGFKGGEVTPIFFMGASFTNSIATILDMNNFALSSALGMVAMFSALTAAPIASIALAAEVFGWKVGLISILSCFIARAIMGRRSIYKD